MTTESGAPAHHWETSWAPLAVVAGTFFLLPLTFSAFFVYDSLFLTAMFAGIGTPLLIAGIAKWVNEGLAYKNIVEGAAVPGMSIFIFSEALVFLALFVSYWMMHLKADTWPPEGTPAIGSAVPIFMILVLVVSSFTMHRGETKLEAGDRGGFTNSLIVTMGLGALFLGLNLYEYNHLLGLGFGTSANAFSSVFYTLTGFHAAHVLVGLGIFVAMLIPALGGRTNKTFVRCAALYWHFVVVVSFFVVSQIYFW